MSRLPRHEFTPRGLTLVETLVACGACAVLIGAVAPVIASMGCDDDSNHSVANLERLAQAHAMYAVDWNDRQFTVTADNLGVAGGSCATYTAMFGCHPPVILGNDCEGAPQGYFFGCGSGSCANFAAAVPFTFAAGDAAGFGSFRLPNAAGFNEYVGGRFYDPTFYAPADQPAYDAASEFFGQPCGYVPPQAPATGPILSTYATSPAAMFDPAVLSKNPATLQYWKSPGSFADGFKSPTVSQAVYPDLKTRMIEHNWLRKPPSPCNPNFGGGCTPWFFNHGFESIPNALFYDGSVRILGTMKAQQDDQRAQLSPGGAPLWSRSTPLGSNGYFTNQSHDFLTDTSHHILTVDGIAGRDTLTAGR